MNFCTHCGKEIQLEHKFCISCGKSVIDPRLITEVSSTTTSNLKVRPCPACNKDVGVTVNKCPHCDTSLKNPFLKKFFDKPINISVVLFLLFQSISAVLLDRNGWKLSQFISFISFIIPLFYLFLRISVIPKGIKTNIFLAMLIVGSLISMYSFYWNYTNMKTLPDKIRNGLNDYWSTHTVDYKRYKYALINGNQLIRFNLFSGPTIKFEYKFENILNHGKNNIGIPIDFPNYVFPKIGVGVRYNGYGGYDAVTSYSWSETNIEPIHAKAILINGSLQVPTLGFLGITYEKKKIIEALNGYDLNE